MSKDETSINERADSRGVGEPEDNGSPKALRLGMPRVLVPRPALRRPNLRRPKVGRPKTGLPEPLEAAWFSIQERVIWPLQDRVDLLGPRSRNRAVLGGGALALLLVGIVAALVLSSGGGSSSPTTTVTEAAAPSEPAAATPATPQPKPKKESPPRETLHGAAPVFSPPSPASKGGEKTGQSKPKATEAEPSSSSESSAASTAPSTSSSPAAARISSDPKGSKADAATADGASAGAATAAGTQGAVPEGPPAGPAALAVAREFAQGFVVYETGGEKAEFKDAFQASATPELTEALLQRPPKQPAGVKVPRAKVLNVVAGPSQGTVYKVSVSLLRVGVTSELRLDMEKIRTAGKTDGKSGKGAEWRVTNVLG